MKQAKAIGFVGGGHLSVVSAVAALAKTAKAKTAIWCYGEVPVSAALEGVQEPGLQDCLQQHRERLHWTINIPDLSGCELLYFAFDVPTDASGNSDLARVAQLLAAVLPVLSDSAILINLSQVPPGWTRAIDFPKERLFYQVETLIFGQALGRALQPDQFIIGSADKSRALPDRYRAFLQHFDCPIAVMDYESAELAKIAINLYLAASVTTTNVLAQVCRAIGADWQDVVPSLRLDPRIGPKAYLSPGLGLTSANIQRDLKSITTLSRRLGVQAMVVEAMLLDSEYRMSWVLQQLQYLGCLTPRSSPLTLAIWGLSYKPNTTVLSGSAAQQVLPLLPSGTRVRVFEPMPLELPPLPGLQISRCATPEAASLGADLLMILTPNPAFADVDWTHIAQKMKQHWVIDPFSVLDADRYPSLAVFQLRKRGPAACL